MEKIRLQINHEFSRLQKVNSGCQIIHIKTGGAYDIYS